MDASYDSAALVIAVGSAFLLFAGGFWTIVSLSKWALDPAESGAVAASNPSQFSLREFALLAIEMQLAVGAVFWWWNNQPIAMWIIVVMGSALLLAWWQGVRRLARCDVTCQVRRATFLTLAIPLAMSSIVAALWLNGEAVMQTCLGRPWPLAPWLAGNLAIIGAFVICRLLTVWTMRRVTPTATLNPSEDGIQYVS